MRICIYTETALPMMGGQEFVVDALAREFRRAGHEVVVLAPQPRSSAAASGGTDYEVVRHPRFISTWRFVEFYRWFLIRLRARFRYDIVHCHSVHPTGYLAVLARRSTGVPVVITSHGGEVNPANPRLDRPGARHKHAMAIAGADSLISIGRFTSDGFRALSTDPAPIHEIPNGVDVAAFARRAERPQGLDARIGLGGYFLFLGRLSRRKGVDQLLEAYRLLEPVGRPLLVLAGAGEAREALERQATEAGLADAVCFAGPVFGEAKTYLLQNCLAVVMPSRQWEAFPLVALEAFACAKPIIASRVAGLEDVVEPGKSGWLVAPESPGELAAALREAIATPAAAGAYGRNGLAVARNHDWPAIAERHIALFEATIAAKRKR